MPIAKNDLISDQQDSMFIAYLPEMFQPAGWRDVNSLGDGLDYYCGGSS